MNKDQALNQAQSDYAKGTQSQLPKSGKQWALEILALYAVFTTVLLIIT